jgi:hypothetical protein
MSFRSVQQAIAAIQAGNVEEGERLLRLALKMTLEAHWKALAYLWLGHVAKDDQARLEYYNAALATEPNNAQIRQYVDNWMVAHLMPPAPAEQPGAISGPIQTIPPEPATLPETGPLKDPGIGGGAVVPPPAGYNIVGIFGGPNGAGTGFFVTTDGLLVTTRFVVGGMESLTIELEPGYQVAGRVVRSFPETDVAFVHITEPVKIQLLPMMQFRIPEDMAFIITSYSGQSVRGRRRSTNRPMNNHWFPTDVAQLPDAGGCAVLDERQQLVGMMTRNTSSTSNLTYGIHIAAIRAWAEAVHKEMSDGGRTYCPHCGTACRAGVVGGYYCEACGSILPESEHIPRRFQTGFQGLYQVHHPVACARCNATVGFLNGACLRCGYKPEPKK